MAQTQQGVAYRYNGRNARTPLGNVTISYDANKRSTISAENGTFSLTLTGKQMGDRIGQVTVKKREMMVFNQQAVDEWSIRKEPLMLILCNADEFEKQKENLIAIGRREAKKKYNKQKAELEAQLNASKIKEAEYEAALDKAYEEMDRLNKNIGEYAELFARIDESEIDTLAQRAVEKFNQGEVEEAIRLFEEGHYMEKLDKALTTSQQADQLMSVAEQAKAKATQDSIKAIQSLKAQIEAYKMKNEWQKAGELLKGMANRLNDSFILALYGDFCLSYLSDFNTAEVCFKRVLTHMQSALDKMDANMADMLCKTLYGLGTVYLRTGNLALGKKCFEEDIKVVRVLYGNAPMTNGKVLYMSLENLGKTYYYMHEYDESENLFLEARDIHKFLIAQDETPTDEAWSDYSACLSGLGTLYTEMKKYKEAEENYLASLDIIKNNLSPSYSYYSSQKYTLTNGLGILYYLQDRNDESEKCFHEALALSKELAKNNPYAYTLELSSAYNNLGRLYLDAKRYTQAEEYLMQALHIRRELSQSNFSAYSSELVRTLDNLSELYKRTNRQEEVEKMYKQALEIRQRLVKDNPKAYEPGVARTLNNLANLYNNTQRFTEAEYMYKQALEIRQRLAKDNPKAYEPDVAQALGSLSFNAIFLNKYFEAEQLAREGLAVDSAQHWIASNLAAAILLQGRYSEAELIYRQYKNEL